MAKLTESQDKALRLACFILGAALPLIGWKIWSGRQGKRFQEIDEAHDNTVEDSFPASDPPSAW